LRRTGAIDHRRRSHQAGPHARKRVCNFNPMSRGISTGSRHGHFESPSSSNESAANDTLFGFPILDSDASANARSFEDAPCVSGFRMSVRCQWTTYKLR
jgi:hypothetical protein